MATFVYLGFAVTLMCSFSALSQNVGASNGLHNEADISHYNSNNSWYGKLMSCSKDEIRCLKKNRIFLEDKGTCVRLHSRVGGYSVVVDELALRTLRRLRAAYYAGATCPDGRRPMAYDGACLRAAAALCRPGYALGLHPFGGAECQPRRRPVPVLQIEASKSRPRDKPGLYQCYFPDFQTIQGADIQSGALKCAEHQRACAASGRLSYKGGCHEVLSSTPCEGGQLLVIDKMAVEENKELIATCRDATPSCVGGAPDAFGGVVCPGESGLDKVHLRADGRNCYL